MGVRLYPVLKQGVTIAEFIGNNDPEAVDAFDTYGFGKFNACPYQQYKDGEDTFTLDSGSENDPELYEQTVRVNYLNGRFNYPVINDLQPLFDKMDGVMWC